MIVTDCLMEMGEVKVDWFKPIIRFHKFDFSKLVKKVGLFDIARLSFPHVDIWYEYDIFKP